jgi:low affinity Fe/Cu permease
MFSRFARTLSRYLGKSFTFSLALGLVLLWLITGPLFKYSDTWQLVINTSTTIITFLMVFLLQNTQNRDTTAVHLKLDEIIRSMENTHNELLKIEELSDEDLKVFLDRYEDLAKQVKQKIQNGESDVGCPEVEFKGHFSTRI